MWQNNTRIVQNFVCAIHEVTIQIGSTQHSIATQQYGILSIEPHKRIKREGESREKNANRNSELDRFENELKKIAQAK